MTKVRLSGIGEMLQAQHSQHQTTNTSIVQAGCRDFYSDWELEALMGYAHVYTEIGIPRIWGKFQMSKECDYNRQEQMAGMMYWNKTNHINIDTLVFFFNLETKEMVNTKFDPEGPEKTYESAEIGISPLMVMPSTTQEIEEDIWREEEAEEPQGTRTQSEALQKKQGQPRLLPRNWYELKRCYLHLLHCCGC